MKKLYLGLVSSILAFGLAVQVSAKNERSFSILTLQNSDTGYLGVELELKQDKNEQGRYELNTTFQEAVEQLSVVPLISGIFSPELQGPTEEFMNTTNYTELGMLTKKSIQKCGNPKVVKIMELKDTKKNETYEVYMSFHNGDKKGNIVIDLQVDPKFWYERVNDSKQHFLMGKNGNVFTVSMTGKVNANSPKRNLRLDRIHVQVQVWPNHGEY